MLTIYRERQNIPNPISKTSPPSPVILDEKIDVIT
jgi:hypothetical protein